MNGKFKRFYKELFTSEYLELRKVVMVQMFLAWSLPFYTVGIVMYMKRMGLPSSHMGITLTSVVIGSVLGHNLSSLLLTRFQLEPKRVMAFCMPILVVWNIQFSWATESYSLLTVLYFGTGLLVGTNFTSVNVIYRRLLPDEENKRESLSARLNIPVNTFAGVSGVVVTSFVGRSVWNLPDTMIGIIAIMVFYRIRVPKETESVITTKTENPLSLKWKLVVIGFPILIVSVALRAVETYFPFLLGAKSGILITVYFIVNGFSGPLITWIVGKTSRRKTINTCILLTGVACLLLSLAGKSFLPLLVASILFGLSARGILTCSKTEMETFAGKTTSASANVNATFQTIAETGKVAGGYLVGFFLSNPLLWCLVALISGLMVLNRATLEKKLYRD